jgi:hypothetical protein
MLSEHRRVETGEAKLSRRYRSQVQGHLRSLEKDEAKNYQNSIKAASEHFRMIDLNLFRVFDAMMLQRSVRKASQILSVTPSAVSHALSRLRRSIGDELFIASAVCNQRNARFSWPRASGKDWKNWSGL